MRAVVTRVKHASVTIENEIHGQIGQGYLVLLGVGPSDTEEISVKLADKICNLRIFEDQEERMNLSLEQVGGSLLVVSQFTLYADTSSRRPGFSKAAKPDLAVPLREIHGPVPGAGLPGGARRVRRRYAGGLPQRRARDHPV